MMTATQSNLTMTFVDSNQQEVYSYTLTNLNTFLSPSPMSGTQLPTAEPTALLHTQPQPSTLSPTDNIPSGHFFDVSTHTLVMTSEAFAATGFLLFTAAACLRCCSHRKHQRNSKISKTTNVTNNANSRQVHSKPPNHREFVTLPDRKGEGPEGAEGSTTNKPRPDRKPRRSIFQVLFGGGSKQKDKRKATGEVTLRPEEGAQ